MVSFDIIIFWCQQFMQMQVGADFIKHQQIECIFVKKWSEFHACMLPLFFRHQTINASSLIRIVKEYIMFKENRMRG